MLKYLVSAVLLFATGSFAQPPKDSATGKITYSGMVIDSGKTKEVLHAMALKWFNKEFKSSKYKMLRNDKDELVLEGSYEMGFNYSSGYADGFIKCTYTLDFSDNSIRYAISGFIWKNLANGKDFDYDQPDPFWNKKAPAERSMMYKSLDTKMKARVAAMMVFFKKPVPKQEGNTRVSSK